jgi:hypothetical protein
VLLDEAVYLVQKNRKTLDFVDDHNAVFRSELLSDPTGTLTKGQINRGIEEIINLRSFQGVKDQRGLASLTRPEQEMGFFLHQSGEIQYPLDIGQAIVLISI